MNFQDNRPLYLQVEASIRNDIREKKISSRRAITYRRRIM